jgi:hypothetical protein
MQNKTIIGLSIFISLGFLINCSDPELKGTSPLLENYYTTSDDNDSANGQFIPIPDDDQISIDFGQVTVETVAYYYLFLPNQGQGPLYLSDVETSDPFSQDFHVACRSDGIFIDCPTGDEGIGALPGKNIVIQISYTPGQAELDNGSLLLTLSSPEHNALTVNLSGEGVTQEIEVCILDCIGGQDSDTCTEAAEVCNHQVGKENLIVDYGQVNLKTSASRNVYIRNLGKQPLILNPFEMPAGSDTWFAYQVQGINGNQLLQGEEKILSVSYTPNAFEENLSQLKIKSNDLDEKEVVVLFSGQGVAPRVCVEPKMIDFGNVITGNPVVEKFSLTNCGDLELDINDVLINAGSSPYFSLPQVFPQNTLLNPGDLVEVEVQFLPLEAGLVSGHVDIFTNDPSSDPATGKTGSISLSGRSIESVCDMQVNPIAADFGRVEINQSTTIGLEITNAGNGACLLEDVAITQNSTANEFSLIDVPGANTTFEPNTSVNLTLGYAPTDSGTDVGILTLYGNDKASPEKKVDINGFGKLPSGTGPVAVCSVDPTNTVPFTTVHFTGDQSYDTNNIAITDYIWSWVSTPAGSVSTLDGSGPNRYSELDMAGSYTAQLVIRNQLQQESAPCTVTVVATPYESIWVEMYWDRSGDDMDLHLLDTDGIIGTSSDCYFGNCRGAFPPDWGVIGYDGDDPRLDRDNILGTGPENINIDDPADGTYTVVIHDHPGEFNILTTNVTVNVYIDSNLVNTFNKAITGESSFWFVCEIDWPSGIVTPL